MKSVLTKTATGRASFEVYELEPEAMTEFVKMITDRFAVKPVRPPVVGVDSAHVELHDERGAVITAGWDNWSGCFVFAADAAGDSLIEEIAVALKAPLKELAQPEGAEKIVGTARRRGGDRIFSWDTRARRLDFGGCWTPKKGAPTSTEKQRAQLVAAVENELGDDLVELRLDELLCHHCGAWVHAIREPAAWSYGMCASCSMDRASEMADD
jgi:hypothetical protein